VEFVEPNGQDWPKENGIMVWGFGRRRSAVEEEDHPSMQQVGCVAAGPLLVWANFAPFATRADAS